VRSSPFPPDDDDDDDDDDDAFRPSMSPKVSIS
jgi:hypothetical protein